MENLRNHPEIKTRVFEFASPKYASMAALARAMGISLSQVYRVRDGKRKINQKFIIGALRAFPEYRIDQLFYTFRVPPDMPVIQRGDPDLKYIYFSHLCRLVVENLCTCHHLQDKPGKRCDLKPDCPFFYHKVLERLRFIDRMI